MFPSILQLPGWVFVHLYGAVLCYWPGHGHPHGPEYLCCALPRHLGTCFLDLPPDLQGEFMLQKSSSPGLKGGGRLGGKARVWGADIGAHSLGTSLRLFLHVLRLLPCPLHLCAAALQ